MEKLNAIYTRQRECQDCHKCIRECPVKAIRVEDGYARVVPELCIMCGICVLVCPHSAKQVRDTRSPPYASVRWFVPSQKN